MSKSSNIGRYASAVFLSSAILLVMEMVAARLIAPYVGVSLYTWSAVIGVILAGLSLGNWIGGVYADRGAGARATGACLLGAAAVSIAVLPILNWLAPLIQISGLSLLSASLLLVLGLFLLPAILIGVVTPLLTTLALRANPHTGHVVGLMHALAALGSILGTFAAAWWLIPTLGSRLVVITCGLLLAALAVPFLRPLRAVTAVIAAIGAGILGLALHTSDALSSPCDRESSYFCIRVIDEQLAANAGQARSMVLDHLLHGTNHAQRPQLLLAPYVHLMDELIRRHHRGRKGLAYFFIGGGAYTQPRAYLAGDPQARITVTELDPTVTEVARESLYLDDHDMRIVHDDARAVLAREPSRYDIIVGDAFHDIAVPYHLVTREFATLVRRRLNDDGIYVLNLVDAYPHARLAKSIVRTLRETFTYVDIWLERLPADPTRVTYVISASQREIVRDRILATHRPARSWRRVNTQLDGTATAAATPVLTDDRAPVEHLIAELFMTDLGR